MIRLEKKSNELFCICYSYLDNETVYKCCGDRFSIMSHLNDFPLHNAWLIHYRKDKSSWATPRIYGKYHNYVFLSSLNKDEKGKFCYGISTLYSSQIGFEYKRLFKNRLPKKRMNCLEYIQKSLEERNVPLIPNYKHSYIGKW